MEHSPLNAFFRRHNKSLAIIGAGGLLLLMMIVRIPIYTAFQRVDLDFSWEMDLAHKLQDQEIAGRDFYFTYGPGSQVIYSLSGVLRPDASPIDRAPLTYLILRIILVTLLMACVWLVPNLDWRTALIVMLIFTLVLSAPPLIYARALLALLAVLVLIRALTIPFGWRRDLACLASGGLCFIGQTVTFEVGIFASLSGIGFFGICLFWWLLRGYLPGPQPLPPRQTARALAFLLAAYIGANLLICLIFKLSSPRYYFFDYIYYNLQLAQSYNYTMGAQWELDALMVCVLFGIALYCALAFIRRFRTMSIDRRYLYIGLLVLSIIHFKGAVVRSGSIKILMSMTPLIFMFLLLAYETEIRRRVTLPAILLTVLMVTAWPFRDGVDGLREVATLVKTPSTFIERLGTMAAHTIPASAVVPNQMADILSPDSYILNFPYENLMAIALGRKSITPVLQPYSAHNTVLQQWYVDQAAAVKDRTEIIYSLDAITSQELEVTQNVTRSPLIFEYIFNNFELKRDQIYNEGYAILQPRHSPISLAGTPLKFEQEDSGDRLRATFPATSCTFLRLHLKIDYPPTSILGRPTPLHIRVLSGPYELLNRRLPAIEAGREFTTYAYIGDPRNFYRIFGLPRLEVNSEQVDAVELSDVDLGLFQVHPSKVTINSIECIDLAPGDVEATQPQRDMPIGPLLAGQVIQQEFTASRNHLEGIYLEMATYGRQNTGSLNLQLQRLEVNGNRTTVAAMQVDMATIQDNSRLLFRFKPQESQGHRYAIVIDAPQATADNTITLYMLSGNPYPSGRLLQGPQELRGDLTFRLLYSR